MSDGELRRIFQQHIPAFHWQSVETWSTGQGVPDCNYCGDGTEGWIEFKFTSIFKVNVGAEQVGWIERRMRAGGNVFVAVRRKHSGGPNKGVAVDELLLLTGHAARFLVTGTLRDLPVNLVQGRWSGGPKNWGWETVRSKLLKS